MDNDKSFVEMFAQDHLSSYQLRNLLTFSLVGIGKELSDMNSSGNIVKQKVYAKKATTALPPTISTQWSLLTTKAQEKNKDIESLIKLAKISRGEISFLFMPYHSTRGYKQNNRYESMKQFRDYLKSNGLEIYDYIDSEKYAGKDEFFADIMHLNKTGSSLFTQNFIKDLNL